jgi:dsDNA-binding SOS-regulon protein
VRRVYVLTTVSPNEREEEEEEEELTFQLIRSKESFFNSLSNKSLNSFEVSMRRRISK